ncbi:MAG: alpha/beta hydrolase [Candidatus Thiodiazotropha sp.]|nr:alpha/beta hydrolase [Candidatus Thiodiazotropha taylori]MBT3057657.1 alpha/beta hydrolase [Candidatus Thiodiazotropha sp. (ex Lucina pensylvanica)]MBT3062583.1 alpha/beta hydrolase [Candidatus Thiodiazotropha sp. (ex Lucina pensylvanica)]MBV2096990.1 alpha/beta hydrolase [Candidatus Thiodiazotropha sp. (ex Codakia orbicularis)]PUB74937.1 MAG: alpha/beta hydrolase [gamma proteobacterium symbiont of Ctena orbiculata]
MSLPPLLKEILLLLLLGLLLLLLFALYLYLNQTNLIHLPNLPGRELGATPERLGLGYENVTLVTEDRVKLDGWYIPHQAPRATLLFFHGNAGNISHRLESIALFNSLGLSVLAIDYRGYGRSEGRPSEKGIYRDAETAWRYLREERGIPGHQILLFGRSLGGAVAAYLAAKQTALGVVLESTFTSVPDMAAELYPWLPVRWLTRYHYDSVERMAAIRIPVMIIHSRDDEIIPFDHGRMLYDRAAEPKRFLELSGDHNYGFMQNIDRYRDHWDDFIRLCRREAVE